MKQKQIVYIAGKINGNETYKEEFGNEKKILEQGGIIVLNPAELPEGMDPQDYMHICFAMIDRANCVVALSNWNDSPGAKLEIEYCNYIGKTVVYLTENNL